MISRCATIGTVHVSFLRPTERNFRSYNPEAIFRGKPAVIRQPAIRDCREANVLRAEAELLPEADERSGPELR